MSIIHNYAGTACSETPSHASVATATVAASTRATAVASAPSARLAVGGEGSERLAFYDATTGALTAKVVEESQAGWCIARRRASVL